MGRMNDEVLCHAGMFNQRARCIQVAPESVIVVGAALAALVSPAKGRIVTKRRLCMADIELRSKT
jgi:hypothetical protein